MLYYISNTTSELDDPDPTKHIGLYLNTLKNVTIDGCGSTLLMNGEMTSFVLDKCEGIVNNGPIAVAQNIADLIRTKEGCDVDDWH